MGLRAFWGAIGGGGIARTFRGSVANQAAMLALPAVRGDWCVRSDINTAYEMVGADATLLANWQAVPNAGAGGSVQNSLAPASTTVPPSVDAVTGGLAGKANTAHTHSAANVTDFSAAADARIANARGAANGVASLDGAGLVPASQLPSYVDDVLESANLAAFPVTGETGKIYVALDTNATYRWSGSAYVAMGSAPQYASQAEAEAGAENTKTMTPLRAAQAIAARAKDALLTGYALGSSAVVAATDSIVQAFAKLQAQINERALYVQPQLISANRQLVASDAWRQNRVNAVVGNLALANDATGIFSGDATIELLAVDGGSFTVTGDGVGNNATLEVPAGCSASSATALGGRVVVQRRAANIFICLSPLASSGGSNTRSYAGVINPIALPNDLNLNTIASINIGSLAPGTWIDLAYIVDADAGIADNGYLRFDLNGVEAHFVGLPPGANTGRVQRSSIFVRALNGSAGNENVLGSWDLLNDNSFATDPFNDTKSIVNLSAGNVQLRMRAERTSIAAARGIRVQAWNVQVRQP